MEDQREVWNEIAIPWKSFRIKPISEVVEFLKDKKGKILDLGCGSGRNFMKVEGKICGVDFSEKMLEYAEQYAKENEINIELEKSEASELPFDNDFFDAAIFVAVLHCINSKEKREKSLRELLRVMKPKAQVLITVWDRDQEKFKGKEKESVVPWRYEGREFFRYYYLYDKEEFLDLLKKVGFKIVKVMGNENSSGLFSKKNIIAIVQKV